MTPATIRRVVRILVGVLAIALVVTGCSSGDGEPSPSPSPSPTRTASPSPSPSPTPEAIAPLTGEPADVDDARRPVLAVKVENTAAARPQTGLEAADVVFEQIVEGGVTRFVALFQSTVPDVIGPVRSARMVDVDLLPAYRPIFAFSGARDDVLAALRAAGVAVLVEDLGPAFHRDPARPRSHDLLVRGPQAYEQGGELEGVRPIEAQWTFSEEAPDGALSCPAGDSDCTDPGAAIELSVTSGATAGWTYDDDAGVYRRAQNGEPSRVTGSVPIGASNVLAFGMDTRRGGCCDTAGNPFTVTEVVGAGDGILLRDGQAYAIRWAKRSPTGRFQLSLGDGTPVTLKPGPSWVHLMPVSRLPPME